MVRLDVLKPTRAPKVKKLGASEVSNTDCADAGKQYNPVSAIRDKIIFFISTGII